MSDINCVRCHHSALELLDHPNCDCGCHVDFRAGLDEFLAAGGTKEKFINDWKEAVLKRQALENVLKSGLFK